MAGGIAKASDGLPSMTVPGAPVSMTALQLVRSPTPATAAIDGGRHGPTANRALAAERRDVAVTDEYDWIQGRLVKSITWIM